MDKIIRVLTAPDGVNTNANNFATQKFDIGGQRYLGVKLFVQGLAAAATTIGLADLIGLLRLRVNTKLVWEIQATELDAIQSSYGAQYAAKVFNYDGGVFNYNGGSLQAAQAAKQTGVFLTIWFAEPWRESYAAKEMYALPTRWSSNDASGNAIPGVAQKPDTYLSSLTLEIGYPNTGNLNAAPAYSITCWPIYDMQPGGRTANGTDITLFKQWKRYTVGYNAAGDLNLDKQLDLVGRIMEIRAFTNATDEITRMQVKRDDAIVRDVYKEINDDFLGAHGFNAPYSNQYRFDMILDQTDRPDSALVLQSGSYQARKLEVIATLGSAAAATKVVTVLAQYYKPLPA